MGERIFQWFLSPRVSRKAFFPAQTVESISGIWEENHFGFIVELNFESSGGGKRISKSVRSLTAARLITSSFLFWPIYISGAEVGFS